MIMLLLFLILLLCMLLLMIMLCCVVVVVVVVVVYAAEAAAVKDVSPGIVVVDGYDYNVVVAVVLMILMGSGCFDREFYDREVIFDHNFF